MDNYSGSFSLFRGVDYKEDDENKGGLNSTELGGVEKQLALYRFKLEMEKGERSILEKGTISSKDLKKELGISGRTQESIDYWGE